MKRYIWAEVNTVDYPEINFYSGEDESLLDAVNNCYTQRGFSENLNSLRAVEDRFECIIKEIAADTSIKTEGDSLKLGEIL
ncbi:MAG: hypothetical protein ACOCQR_02340 [bacterium]